MLASDVRLDRLDFFFVLLETVGQSFDLVFQILHFERKFAAQGLDLVDFRKFSLQLVRGFSTSVPQTNRRDFLFCLPYI